MSRNLLPRPPWSTWSEGAAVLGFWAFFFGLEFVRHLIDPFFPSSRVTPGIYFSITDFALWVGLTPVVFRLARLFPLDRGHLRRSVLVVTGTGLVASILVESVNVALFMWLVAPGLPKLPIKGAMNPLSMILGLRFLDEFVIFMALLAVGYARNFFIRLSERERETAQLQAQSARLQAEAARLQAQLSDAHLAALRMQLNPHFLFNTLNTVSTLAESDPEGVQRITARLSALLRRALEGSGRQEVALADEISFLNDYLEIQLVRFQGRLKLERQVDPEALGAMVPNLILQPILENALEHGLDGIQAEHGRIVLRGLVDRKSGALVLQVQDNGPGLSEERVEDARRRGRVGLVNTRSRLDALYGPDASLDFSDAPGGGLIVTIRLPYHTHEDLRVAAYG